MVQLLEELPPELQAHIAGSLDAAAAKSMILTLMLLRGKPLRRV